MNKKFSILTAAYNSERYIEDWANSILVQKYRPLEVVVVDDKSNDETLNLLKKIKEKFDKENIEFNLIIPEKKLYCGSAYNLAIKKATGNYFGILDSDDMLEPWACETIVKIYEENSKVSWIYTQYNKYNKRMDRIIKKGFCCHPGKNKTILDMESNNINVYGHWRTFSDRINSFKNLFGKGLKCCVDKHLGFRLEEVGIGMFVDKICYKYRTRRKGEKSKSIVNLYSLYNTRTEIVKNSRLRRKKNKVYPILIYK